MADGLNFRLEVGGFEAGLTALMERVAAAAPAAVDAGLHEIERAAKRNASGRPGPNVVTGTLRRSIQVQPARPVGSGTWSGSVGPTVVYARIQEQGGTIRPRRGPFLVFRGEDGGLVHVRQVTIPARPYLRPAVEEFRGRGAATLARVLGEAMRV